MKNILFLAVISSIAVFAVSCGGNAENASFRTLSMEEGISLYSQLLSDDNLPENEKPVLLDVRHDDEYAAGHIPGAKLLTMETIDEEN
ncbi:MAG: rhodanese-like domain-containing protein, partial [Elusimicrobiales bacterium]|nr:rhodanese-like domain-containing protein [Elusimicrobiales bacterium]